jgi:hypothetical protein
VIENYTIDEFGVIHQNKIIKKIKTYDVDYVKNSYNNYGEQVRNMSHLRLGYLMGSIGQVNKILDVGYGNGDFLSLCTTQIPKCYGNDVSGYKIPKDCVFIDNVCSKDFDVVCFFDSLEHFEDIDFIKNLKTKYIFISLPWCHNHSDEWFKNWKHLREDEHLHHFNDKSLINFMNHCGYEMVSISNIEDTVRTSINNDKNILSGIFKKYK